MILESLTLQPIGYISSPYTDKYDAPRQPGVEGKHNESIITLLPHCNFEQALQDLEGFDRIWLVSWFHRNSTWKPKVLPPRSGRTKRGVFATRSPHRPNPIGLSVCTLQKINGLKLFVNDVDLLDGTPILDIKPYLPYSDSFPGSRSGWIGEAEETALEYEIMVSELAQTQLDWLAGNSELQLADIAFPILRRDPFPYSSRRITILEDGYVIAIKSWRILFRIDDKQVIIDRIASGYSSEYVFLNPEKQILNDHSAHIGFYKIWKNSK
ncbi:MAG: tRNA (N6-threonylcarbamoyladenosine(37)-N6)-methyltransferase TrmO [Ignavibacteriae bacterium]|nr:tRNA (N6-threonylcarbamoyladenosine(37)-N6)-methyltransferase TrmO [Ignavibacteriota bacterium]